MQGSIEEISSTAKSEATTARMKEDNIVTTYNKEKAEFDKAQKAQECFDKATALLEEVGNMSEKPEVVKDGNSAKITLFDGRFIKVDYDANGEIVAVAQGPLSLGGGAGGGAAAAGSAAGRGSAEGKSIFS